MIRLILIISSFLYVVVSINQNEGNELLEKAAGKMCSQSNSTVSGDCMKKIIQGYINIMSICQRESYKNCEMCTNQINFIQTGLSITGSSYKLVNFVDVAMKLGLLNSNSSLACTPIASHNTAYYNSALQDYRSRNSEIASFITLVNSNVNNQILDSSFTKCISTKELIGEADLSKVKMTESKEIIAFLVLHQLNGFLMSSNCTSEPPYPLVITELYKFMGLSAPTDKIAESHLEKLVKSLKLGNPTNPSGSDGDDHDDHDHSRQKRSIGFLQRIKRATAAKKINCLTIDQLYDVAGLDHAAGMTFNQFQTMAPLLLQQVATNSCVPTDKKTNTVSVAEKYGYGTLAVFIVCVCSLVGVCIIPMRKKTSCYSFGIAFLIGMGIGTLVADAILHLIPQTIGMHSHDPKIIGMSCGILITILAMILLESLFTIRSSAKSAEIEVETYGESKMSDLKDNVEELKESQETLAPMTAAYMVIIGDTIHNLADGLAIGAAFTISLSQGLAISIAAFCHELPHEFGDFAILLSTGMQWKWALLANFLSSLSAFVGLYIGIAVSSNYELAQNIILTIAAGIFLYVALSDMMPHLQEIIRIHGCMKLLAGIFGIILGFIILGILAFFEENIKSIKAN